MESGDLILIPQLDQVNGDVLVARVDPPHVAQLKVVPTLMCSSSSTGTTSLANPTPTKSFAGRLIPKSGVDREKDFASLTTGKNVPITKLVPTTVDDASIEIFGTGPSPIVVEADMTGSELSLIQASLTQGSISSPQSLMILVSPQPYIRHGIRLKVKGLSRGNKARA
jgi:hypothetical protein